MRHKVDRSGRFGSLVEWIIFLGSDLLRMGSGTRDSGTRGLGYCFRKILMVAVLLLFGGLGFGRETLVWWVGG